MTIQIVILAAGLGKRMQSTLPKVLHCIGGKPMLQHVIETALTISPEQKPIVVFGHEGKKLQEAFANYPIHWVLQKEQLGTGHALLQALPEIKEAQQVLVLSGDVPLISVATLQHLINETSKKSIGLLTANLNNPAGYGRIKRDKKNNIKAIIEEKDASIKERTINEINSGIYLVPTSHLQKWLPKLNNKNAQKEYYLTDIISEVLKEKISVQGVAMSFSEEIEGINDRVQLARLERVYQRRLAEKWLRAGVTLLDPERFDIRGDCQIGQDVIIDVGVILEGKVVIGDRCHIGPYSILRNVTLANGVEIKANSILENVEIAADCRIGPFARLRPGTKLASDVHIGNFVEIKNSVIGQGSKINHLSYIGDSDIGKHVNVGAGTITCNYDGVNKHKTIIGDQVQIGSNTQLVAPITIGEGATIGAGSTVTKDVPPHQLTLTHKLEQRSIKNWQRPGFSAKKESLENN